MDITSPAVIDVSAQISSIYFGAKHKLEYTIFSDFIKYNLIFFLMTQFNMIKIQYVFRLVRKEGALPYKIITAFA